MRDATFTETLQVALVVKDLDASMKRYVEDYGVGPWQIYEFNPGTVKDMREDGFPVERSWRLALATVGGVMWELIEPRDDGSIYAQFLAEHGEGIHHTGVGVADYGATLTAFEATGRKPLLSGEYNGITFAYLPTEGDLGMITEIFDVPPGLEQKPDAVYP